MAQTSTFLWLACRRSTPGAARSGVSGRRSMMRWRLHVPRWARLLRRCPRGRAGTREGSVVTASTPKLALQRIDGLGRGWRVPASQPNIGFSEWADRWLASLERKPSTVGSYRSTIVHAKEVFGSMRVRRIGPEDIARFNVILREIGLLRVDAREALARARRVPAGGRLLSLRRLQPGSRTAAGAEASAGAEGGGLLRERELPRLFAHLQDEPYRTLCLVALKTGMRQGELLALRWCDVDLDEAVVRVRRSYTGGALGTPKNRERRDVDLISDVVELLAAGEANTRARRDDGLVFPGSDGSGFLSHRSLLRRHLYPAMAAAGVPAGRADAGEADIPQLPAHVREARARERRPDHLALTPPRPLLAQGDHRHLRPLGTRRTEAPGRQDGGRLPGLTRTPGVPPVAGATARATRDRENSPPEQEFLWAGQGSNLRPWD